jgi:hypothetical protein
MQKAVTGKILIKLFWHTIFKSYQESIAAFMQGSFGLHWSYMSGSKLLMV